LGEFHVAECVETHGLDCGPYERFYEEFVICSNCAGRFAPADWDAAGEAPGLENDTPEDLTPEANFNAENYAMPRT
jgi:hypothetical protein